MRRLFLLAAALLSAYIFVGCQNEEDTPTVDLASKVAGEWHCSVEEYNSEVYVAFATDGTFDEYQRLGDSGYRHYAGSWNVKDGTLSGIYADGVEWGSSYTLSFDGDTMTLTATNDSAEAITYTKTAIPTEVKDSAIEPFASRTEDAIRWF